MANKLRELAEQAAAAELNQALLRRTALGHLKVAKKALKEYLYATANEPSEEALEAHRQTCLAATAHCGKSEREQTKRKAECGGQASGCEHPAP